MVHEITRFVNWMRRRNPHACTWRDYSYDLKQWRDYSYDLKQFVAAVGDHPPNQITIQNIDQFIITHCLARYHDGLPDWFIEQITKMQHLRQAHWRPSRLPDAIRRFWANHTRMWRWLLAREGIEKPKDVKRQHLFAYIDERLDAGYAVKSINQDLRAFQATLRFLQEREIPIPLALLRVPTLKEPDALPRFLTDEEVSCLQTNIEQQVN